MAFQQAVNRYQAAGVIGDIVRDGATRGQSVAVDDKGGIIGYAATFVGDGTNTVVMGGTGAFAGIVANTKTAPLYGTAAEGTLAPSLAIQPHQQCEVVNMCSGLVVKNTNTSAYVGNIGKIGSQVWFNQTDGAIYIPTEAEQTAGVTVGYTMIAGARTVVYNVEPATATGQNLAVIELTLAETVLGA